MIVNDGENAHADQRLFSFDKYIEHNGHVRRDSVFDIETAVNS